MNVTEVETGMEFHFTTAATSYSVSNLLHPYYTYECIVSAYTIAIGPYTDEVIVMTHEDGVLNQVLHNVICCVLLSNPKISNRC